MRVLGTIAAAAAIGLVALWYHLTLVDSRLGGIIAVFAEVAIYPADACLAVLAVIGARHPPALDVRGRWLAVGLTALAASALLSSLPARDPLRAAGLAGHLGVLALAWLGLRTVAPSRHVLVTALVASAMLQSALSAAQFVFQQTLVPAWLGLPWLPSDPAQGGTPVILDATGGRLLRGFGTFPHPNVLGGYLAIALVCVPVLTQHTRLRWLFGAIITLGLLTSFSRAAWLAALVGLSVTWCSGARHRAAVWWLPPLLILGVAIAIGLSPLAPIVAQRLSPLGAEANALERGSVENRLALDSAALVEIRNHLPLGVGGANYGLAAVAEGLQEGWGEPVPNLALLITAELGLPGLASMVLIVAGVLLLAREGPGGLDVAATAAFAALVVLAMLDHYLWTMPLGRVIAWTPFALTVASAELAGGATQTTLCAAAVAHNRGNANY